MSDLCTYPMAIRTILKFPAPELKQPAHPVQNIDTHVQDLVTDLVETMYAAPGLGVPATQLASSQRVIVLEVSEEEPKLGLIKLINPVLVEAEGSILWEEGCLSVVDYTAEVRRASH